VQERVLVPGYAADDDAAFHFEGTELREVVTQRDGARGYHVTVEGEEPLEARLL
jgi:dipeptidase E